MTLTRKQIVFVVIGEIVVLALLFAMGAHWAMNAVGWCGI